MLLAVMLMFSIRDDEYRGKWTLLPPVFVAEPRKYIHSVLKSYNPFPVILKRKTPFADTELVAPVPTSGVIRTLVLLKPASSFLMLYAKFLGKPLTISVIYFPFNYSARKLF